MKRTWQQQLLDMLNKDRHVVERREHEIEIDMKGENELLHRGLQIPRLDVVFNL